MMFELAHIEDDDALSFALGSVWSALIWRLATPEAVMTGARFGISAGASLLAAFALSFAIGVSAHTTPAYALMAIAAFYGGAALLAATVGLGGLVQYAATGLVLNSGALMVLVAAQGALESETFLRALILEEYCLLIGLVGVVAGARWLARRLAVSAL